MLKSATASLSCAVPLRSAGRQVAAAKQAGRAIHLVLRCRPVGPFQLRVRHHQAGCAVEAHLQRWSGRQRAAKRLDGSRSLAAASDDMVAHHVPLPGGVEVALRDLDHLVEISDVLPCTGLAARSSARRAA